MKNSAFWKPVTASIIATPICLFLAVASAGAGHGNYGMAIVLFPYSMLLGLIFGAITLPLFLLAIIQMPLYGIILGAAAKNRKLIATAVALFIAHIAAVVVFILIPNDTFQ